MVRQRDMNVFVQRLADFLRDMVDNIIGDINHFFIDISEELLILRLFLIIFQDKHFS